MKIVSKELTSQYHPEDVARGLLAEEPIVYSSNGNRGERPEDFLEKIEFIAASLGVTRLADISYLSPTKFPVFQSARPSLYLSADYGQNSGAQGKGSIIVQAKISCIMETIESYCAEPRAPNLVRGSFESLKSQNIIVSPNKFVCRHATEALLTEPLMWTRAHSTLINDTVLVPAEAVYFPFISNYYKTRSIFVCGSNGLASGSTYLEATVHALYEIIERHYVAKMGSGEVTIEAIFEQEVEDENIRVIFDATSDCVIQLYSLSLPKTKNLPMIMCCLVTGDTFYTGWGCSATVDISISRAISEALQCRATHISGSREDMMSHTLLQPENNFDMDVDVESDDDDIFGKCEQPSERTVHISQLKHTAHNKMFRSLNEEYEFVVEWLSSLGFNNLLISNLTRYGIDVPVVKVIIPGMDVPKEFKKKSGGSNSDLSPFYRQFSIF